ncbi:MAG: hypothetical protein U0270_41300 [Labilithrix sp.]
MSKLFMLGGMVSTDADPVASAYVVVSEGSKSRMYRVSGPVRAPRVEEQGAGTTFDSERFRRESARDLEGRGPLEDVDPSWACEAVRIHLRRDLGF